MHYGTGSIMNTQWTFYRTQRILRESVNQNLNKKKFTLSSTNNLKWNEYIELNGK